MSTLQDYLSNITNAYNAGNASEHTHRPALNDLIESLATSIVPSIKTKAPVPK